MQILIKVFVSREAYITIRNLNDQVSAFSQIFWNGSVFRICLLVSKVNVMESWYLPTSWM